MEAEKPEHRVGSRGAARTGNLGCLKILAMEVDSTKAATIFGFPSQLGWDSARNRFERLFWVIVPTKYIEVALMLIHPLRDGHKRKVELYNDEMDASNKRCHTKCTIVSSEF